MCDSNIKGKLKGKYKWTNGKKKKGGEMKLHD
jgi:hypothetical protein